MGVLYSGMIVMLEIIKRAYRTWACCTVEGASKKRTLNCKAVVSWQHLRFNQNLGYFMLWNT